MGGWPQRYFAKTGAAQGTTGGKVSGGGLKRSSQWEKVALVVQIILQIWLAAA